MSPGASTGERRRPRLALGWSVALVVLLAAAAPLAAGLHTGSSPLSLFVAALVFGSFGTVIATRRPGNPAGWLLLVAATGETFSVAFSSYGQYADRNPGSLPWGRTLWTVGGMGWWVLPFAMLPLLVLAFPDGHLPGPRWRWVQRVLYGATPAAVVVVGLAQPRIDGDSHAPVNPLHGVLPGLVTGVLVAITFATVLGGAVAAFVALVRRMRRATGIERAQHQWLVAGMATFGVFGVAGFVPPLPQQLVGVGFVAFIGSLSVAILRYRLYDLGRLLSRTVSYAVLSAVVGGCYVGGVAVTSRVLPFSSSVGVAASTLAAAAVFRPARRRIQVVVDHRFNRARYDTEHVVEVFAARLRDQLDDAAVAGDLAGVVSRTLQPARLSFWTVSSVTTPASATVSGGPSGRPSPRR